MTDERIERSRIEAAERAADLIRRNPPDSSRKYLGTVYDGGNMPTANPAWYLTHPTFVTGSEVEGVGGAFSTTDETVPVLVIGSQAPSVGDVLSARNIGGIWIAERGKAATRHFTDPCECGIPATLNATISGCSGCAPDFPTSWSFVISGGESYPAYQYPCGPTMAGYSGVAFTVTLECLPGPTPTIQCLFHVYPAEGTILCTATLVSFTCSPFSATFSLSPACTFGYAGCTTLVLTE